MTGLAADITARLRAAGTPERAAQEQRYLKSDMEHFGATVPEIRRVTRAACRAAGELDHHGVVELAEELWRPAVHECRMAAVEVLTAHRRLLRTPDLAMVERLIREARTWALVDGLAVHVAGDVAAREPGLAGGVLDRWARDDGFWVRRSALLALLPELRRGAGDFARFGRYADAMLSESEFFVRKAIGWVLRETAKQRPELVAGWLAPRTHRASGVTMREAVKYLPADRSDELMAAYRDRRPAG